jgi:hypothetical protein
LLFSGLLTGNKLGVSNVLYPEPHEVWSEPAKGLSDRIHVRFIGVTWLITVAVIVSATVVATLLIDALFSVPASDPEASAATVLTFCAAFITFFTFLAVMNLRLQKIDGDRLLNSLGVALLHLLVVGFLVLAGVVLRESGVWDPSQLFPGHRLTEIGHGFILLERTAATCVAACLMAPAMLPAVGRAPHGVQSGNVPTERML